jgi:hypothetical protein
MVALSHELDELNQKIVLDTAAFLATNIAIQAPQGRYGGTLGTRDFGVGRCHIS